MSDKGNGNNFSMFKTEKVYLNQSHKKVRPEWFKKLPMHVENYGDTTGDHKTMSKCKTG